MLPEMSEYSLKLLLVFLCLCLITQKLFQKMKLAAVIEQKTRNQSSIVLLFSSLESSMQIAHSREEGALLSISLGYLLRPNSDSVRVLLMLASSSLIFFSFTLLSFIEV